MPPYNKAKYRHVHQPHKIGIDNMTDDDSYFAAGEELEDHSLPNHANDDDIKRLRVTSFLLVQHQEQHAECS
jgi:hypothetical protein